jgi:hypothetical protein
MFHQKRLTVAQTGMSLFTSDFPNSLVLEDDDTAKDTAPKKLHIYILDETETAKTVVVAFGLDYKFSHIASEEESKILRKQKLRGVEAKSEDEEEDEEFSDVLAQAEQINSSGSSLEN